MINKDELREYIKQVIREELQVEVDYSSANGYYDHAKIRVNLRLGNEFLNSEEFSYNEVRIYE